MVISKFREVVIHFHSRPVGIRFTESSPEFLSFHVFFGTAYSTAFVYITGQCCYSSAVLWNDSGGDLRQGEHGTVAV